MAEIAATAVILLEAIDLPVKMKTRKIGNFEIVS